MTPELLATLMLVVPLTGMLFVAWGVRGPSLLEFHAQVSINSEANVGGIIIHPKGTTVVFHRYKEESLSICPQRMGSVDDAIADGGEEKA